MALPETITIWQMDHRTGQGQRITGETWSFTGCRNPNGDAFTPTAAEPFSDGRYRFAWSADAYGDWVFDVQALSDPTNEDYNYATVVTVVDTSQQVSADVEALLGASVTGYGAGTLGGKIARIGTLNVVTGPVDPMSADRTIIYGDEETLTWSNDTWDIAAEATVQMSAYYAGVTTLFAGTRVNATTVSVALTAEQTGALVPGRNVYMYRLAAGDDVLVTGRLSVR